MTGRQEELIAGRLDASLTPAEQEELLAALRADEGFARAFAEEVELHRGLQFAASRSEAGDRRAADRILHFVRASQEGTRFAERVNQRARARVRSSAGPALAAAVLLAIAGLLVFAGTSRKIVPPPEIVERPEPPIQVREVPKPEPPRPVEDEAARRKRIEEELRTAVGTKKVDAPAKREEPRPEVPPVVVTPEPKPEPPKPEPTRVESPPALARLESIQGEVVVGGVRATSGAELRDGATVEGSAVVRLVDGTRIELAGEAKLHEKLTGKRAAGRGLTLARGSLSADVAKQPAGTAFLFATPHAEVQVVGTRLTIQSGAETRVDVQEGQVRVMSLKAGPAVTLGPGQGSEVGPSGLPRPFLQGLRALYFDQNNFKGQFLERPDARIDLFLDSAKNELPPVGADRSFAVRWEGRFLAETAGEYVFLLSVDGQVKFTMDGQDLVSDPRGAFHPIARNVVRRKLAAGWHDVVVEYTDDLGSSRCGLRYVPPGAKLPENDTLQADSSGFAIPPRLFTHHRR